MKQELTTKLVLVSVLTGVSTIAGATTIAATPAENSMTPSVREELVVSQAARAQIEAKLLQASFTPEALQGAFYQIKRGTFIESGPTFAETVPHVPMRL